MKEIAKKPIKDFYEYLSEEEKQEIDDLNMINKMVKIEEKHLEDEK